MLVIYFITSILILLYTLVVGIGLTKILKWNILHFPMIFTIFIGIISFIFSLSHLHFRVLFLIPFFLLAVPFYKSIIKINNENRFLLKFFVGVFLFYTILQIFVPYYPLGRDWYYHYKTSLEISENNFQLAGDRNPLFNLIEAGFLTIFGRNFYVAQIVSSILGSFIIFPYYMISRKFLKRKTILFALLFLVFNLFILENILYNWPKMLSATFTMYFIFFILERNYNLSLLNAVLGVLTHESSLFINLPVYLIETFRNKKWLKTFVLFLVIIVLIIFLKKITGNIGVHYLVPFAVEGNEKVVNTEDVIGVFFSKPLSYHFFVRIVNLANTMFPVIPILKIINLLVGFPIIYIHKTVNISELPIIYHYFHSLPGALTIGVYLFAMVSLFKNRKTVLVKYIIISSLFGIFYFGYIIPGVARNAMHPIIPLLIIYALKDLENKNSSYLILVFAISIIELLLFSYLYMDFINNMFIKTAVERGWIEIINVGTINKLIFG